MPDSKYAPADRSPAAILARGKEHAAEGYPEFDPITRSRVVLRPDGHGGHRMVVRAVANTIQEAFDLPGRADVWVHNPEHPELSTWFLDGLKKERDVDTLRGGDLIEEPTEQEGDL